MKLVTDMNYFPMQEKLVDILCQRTENNDRHFFRILVAYYFSKVSSMMRAVIDDGTDKEGIPTNMYAINLAISGYGKGKSMNIMEDQVISGFRKQFQTDTFFRAAEQNLAKLAVDRSVKSGEDPDEVELPKLKAEFRSCGKLLFSFDSGTTPALKQMRMKLLMANAGSMNMEIDEIGSNLLGNSEIITTFLELFDVGKLKQKLVKNTAENIRLDDIEGRTPANTLLFGTPSRVFDGAKVENEMRTMLQTGYARRCFFGYATEPVKTLDKTAEEIYESLNSADSANYLSQAYAHFTNLGDELNFGVRLDVPKDVSILNIQYKSQCEKEAHELPEHEEILKAELNHRYFKALKLAGTYAFIEGSPEVTEEHLYNAIKLVHDSGEALKRMLKRERNYMRIAKYLADIGTEITHVDLMEDLPCYNVSKHSRMDLIEQATAWGYTNNILIKRNTVDGVEFIKGETLQKVDLNNLRFAFSTRLAEDYNNDYAVFSDLHKLTQTPGVHWVNHHLEDGDVGKGYRKKENVIAGCDCVAIDIDEGCTIEKAQTLLNEYAYHMHITKSHTPEHHRFRIVMPLSHQIYLNDEDFKQFMKNINDWLPFNTDESTIQRERKWQSFKGEYWDNEGKPIDALLFIPKTKKEENFRNNIADLSNLDNLERWFVANTGSGSRSNNLIRYALMLVDSGAELDLVKMKVINLNAKLPDPLDESEIHATIMLTVAKKIQERSKK